MRFPKSVRLLKSSEFDRVMKQRQSASNGFVVLYAAPNELGITRLGLIVSRKCGNAVVRNSWKRGLREAFRLGYLDLPVGYDLVVLPRRGATPVVAKLRTSLVTLASDLEIRLSNGRGKQSDEYP